MTKQIPTIREYQEDGSFIDRPLTAEEIAQNQADHDKWLAEQNAIEAQKAARISVLEKLGLTEEEAALLLK